MKKRKSEGSTTRLKKTLIILSGIFLGIVLLLVAFGAKVFFDVKGTADQAYESVDRTHKPEKVDLKKQEPFSVLLLGVDSGGLGRTEQGRSDTLIVATVNPKTQETFLLSLPRDTYTEIVGYGTEDKINHAYAFGGTAMSIATVEKLLDIPIDYYAAINMEGIESLVDAVGGVEVDNSFAFTYEDTDFPEGVQTLDGKKALQYVRMRYDDPDGDYGRQARQRQLIIGIAKQALSIKGVTGYQKILSSLGKNVSTDISFNEVSLLIKNYRNAVGDINSGQIKGEGFMQDGVSYQRIEPEELERVQTILKDQLQK